MKSAFRTPLALTVSAGAALAAVTLVGVNHAQGQQPAGGGFGGQPPGGRSILTPGGIGRLMQGTITEGDAAAGTITIKPAGGAAQVIKVNADTTMQVQETILVSNLVIGDMVQVQGIPTGISATSITAGTPPAFLSANRGRAFGGPGGPGAGGAQAGQLDANGNLIPQGPPPASAMATGKVVSTSPLTISVAENMDVVLKLGHDAKVIRYSAIPFANLKVGDTVTASGRLTPDGTYEAASIGVNLTLGPGPGGPGPGGFGGRALGGGQ